MPTVLCALTPDMVVQRSVVECNACIYRLRCIERERQLHFAGAPVVFADERVLCAAVEDTKAYHDVIK